MSWDVILLRLPKNVASIGDLADDFDANLAPVQEVRQVLKSTLPTINLSDPAWGVLEAEHYSIEFNVGDQDPCTSVMLHVRGSDDAIEPIRVICAATGWRAFDCGDGDIIDFSGDPAKGLRAWREYRDRVAPGSPEKGVALPMPNGGRAQFDTGLPKPGEEEHPEKRWWQFWR